MATELSVGRLTTLPFVAASYHTMLPPEGGVAVAVSVCMGFWAHCTSPCADGADGRAFTVTGDVVLLQPVVVLVYVKVTVPATRPETTPPLVTVATVGLELVQVPPVVGESVIVLPAQTADPADTLGTGYTVTSTLNVGPTQLAAVGVTT